MINNYFFSIGPYRISVSVNQWKRGCFVLAPLLMEGFYGWTYLTHTTDYLGMPISPNLGGVRQMC